MNFHVVKKKGINFHIETLLEAFRLATKICYVID